MTGTVIPQQIWGNELTATPPGLLTLALAILYNGILLDLGKWDGAYYLAGYTVELALKACIIKTLMATDADPDLLTNWGFARDWSEEKRYHRIDKAEAEALYTAVADTAHGVCPWIKTQW